MILTFFRTANVDKRGKIIPPSVVFPSMKSPTIKPTQGNYNMIPEFEKAWDEHLKLAREIRDLLAQSAVKKEVSSSVVGREARFDSLLIRKEPDGHILIQHDNAAYTILNLQDASKLRAFLCE